MSFLKIEAQQIFYSGLEQAINRYLQLDPDYRQKLIPLYGSVIEVLLTGIGLRLYLRTDEQGIIVQSFYEGEADCTIKGTPLGLMKLGMNDKTGQMKGLFSGEVEILGNVQLGQKMNTVLDSINIDWEEHLSHITGDVIAYKLGQLFRSGKEWLGSSSRQMSDNLRDYIYYESNDLPIPAELNGFIDEVDVFRNDVARCEARLMKLQQTVEKNKVD